MRLGTFRLGRAAPKAERAEPRCGGPWFSTTASRRGPFTPAHAGRSPAPATTPARASLYPRARGEVASTSDDSCPSFPLPPRTRGGPCRLEAEAVVLPSTPVHTGKSPRAPHSALRRPLYPRAHGEVIATVPEELVQQPLPPCTRGSLLEPLSQRVTLPSTPVHTGKSGSDTPRCRSTPLYPRAHGEVDGFTPGANDVRPLPPCTRGSLAIMRARRSGSSSTPVHTGKSPPADRLLPGRALYPRAHGEVGVLVIWRARTLPLPPCTRGSRNRLTPPLGLVSSTPVHTGKSRSPAPPTSTPTLYPRAHGEVTWNR